MTALVDGSTKTDSLLANDIGKMLVNQTPFYAESGGQLGDTGIAEWEGGYAQINDTVKTPPTALVIPTVNAVNPPVVAPTPRDFAIFPAAE